MDYFKLLDDCLTYCYSNNKDTYHPAYVSKEINYTREITSAAMRYMAKQGHLDTIQSRSGEIYYKISIPGAVLHESGGYAKLREQEEKLKELNRKQIQSSIDTNDSVIRTNTTQKALIIVATFLSCASFLRDGKQGQSYS
jgi:hydroxymethylglutaryl-CoA reductase